MKHKLWIINMFAALLFLAILVPGTSHAYENATKKINIIYQYDSKWKNVKWKVKCTQSKDLYTAGCGTFALAHAIQWLQDERMNVDELVDHMLDLGCHTNSDASIYTNGVKVLADEYGLVYVDIGKNPSKSTLKSVFDNGGVIVSNIYFTDGGHYMLAVGYKEENDKLYIQMVDSSPHSTIKRFTAYSYDTMTRITGNYDDHKQYWLTYEEYSGTKNGIKDGAYFRWNASEWGFALYYSGISVKDRKPRVCIFREDTNIFTEPHLSDHCIADYVSKGDKIKTVGALKDEWEREWYITEDDTYVCGSHVYAYEYNNLCSMRGVFLANQSGDIKSAPYTESSTVSSFPRAYALSVVRFVTNDRKDIWAELSSGDYALYFYNDSVSPRMSFVSLSKNIELTGVVKPRANLSVGESVGLRGVITAAAPIERVRASIINRERNSHAVDPVIVRPNSFTTSVDLNASINGININQSLKFGSLRTGWYTYKVEVYLGYMYNGILYDLGRPITVISSDFTVGNPIGEDPPPLPDEPEIVSGTCGNNMTWSYSNGILNISGTGNMYTYTDLSKVPWIMHKNKITSIIIDSGVQSLSMEIFMGYPSLESVTLPDTLVTIEQSAFESCTKLSQITIPASVSTISSYAFADCSSLSSVTFTSAIKYFGCAAFQNCTSLKSVTIPDGSEMIGDYAFYGCANLKTASIPSSVILISQTAFNYCSNLEIHCDYNSTAYDYAVNNNIPYVLNQIQVESISFDFDSVSIHLGTTKYVGGVWVTPSNAEFGYFIWNSSNPDVATINSSGYVTAHSLGTTIISATTAIGGKQAYCTVTIVPPRGFCGDNVEWSYNNGELIISGTGDMYDYKYYSVTPWFDYLDEISFVSVGEGVTSIGDNAFHNGYNINIIEMPSTLNRIGKAALYHCENLQYLNIPDSVQTIEYAAFAYCHSIQTVSVPDGVTSIPEACFNNCISLTDVMLPDVIDIGEISFAHCDSLRYLYINGAIQNIGFGAFAVCKNLTKVVFSTDQEVTLGTKLFAESPEITIYCRDNTSIQAYAIQNNIPYVIIGGNAGSSIKWFFNEGFLMIYGNGPMDNYIYSPWEHLKASIDACYISDGITTIGNRAFYNCSNLTSIYLPNTLTHIGIYSFCECAELKTISMPYGLQTIEEYAFEMCGNLTSIIIPASVNEIKSSSFRRCSSLVSISVDANNQTYCSYDGVLYSKDKTKLICYPSGRQGTYKIPDFVNKIDVEAFRSCSKLTSISIPDSVKSIEPFAFYDCDGLLSVYIEEGLRTISSSAFSHCNNLIDIYLPYSVTEYDDNGSNDVFANCPNIIVHAPSGSTTETYVTSLGIPFEPTILQISGQCGYNVGCVGWSIYNTELTIYGTGDMLSYTETTHTPWYVYRDYITMIIVCDGVTSIGNSAFAGFTTVSVIDLPYGLHTIGDSAFRLCSNIKTIDIPSTISKVGRSAFEGCTSLKSFNYPENSNGFMSAVIRSKTFKNCFGLKNIYLPEGIEAIENWAFQNNTGLEWIMIPRSVTRIENLAFEGSDLVKIYCWEGSTAHQYAMNHNIPYCLLDTPIDNPDFTLPSGITVIEAEAFYGIPAKRIKLPQDVRSIGNMAFANCRNLTGIYIPDSCTFIAANAFFSAGNDLTIYGNIGSYAETYAYDHGYQFVSDEKDGDDS